MKLEKVLGDAVNNGLLYAVDSSALLYLLVFHWIDRFNPLRMEVAGRMVVFEGCLFGGGRSDGMTVFDLYLGTVLYNKCNRPELEKIEE